MRALTSFVAQDVSELAVRPKTNYNDHIQM
jgi:hypothetical protein